MRSSLSRREKRIEFLKSELRRIRDREKSELEAASDIIAGLEELLLLPLPRTDEASARRICELEKRLAEMTRLAEMLFRRTIADSSGSAAPHPDQTVQA